MASGECACFTKAVGRSPGGRRFWSTNYGLSPRKRRPQIGRLLFAISLIYYYHLKLRRSTVVEKWKKSCEISVLNNELWATVDKIQSEWRNFLFWENFRKIFTKKNCSKKAQSWYDYHVHIEISNSDGNPQGAKWAWRWSDRFNSQPGSGWEVGD